MTRSLFPSMLPILDPAALRARVQQRSYWRLRFINGRIVNEWDVDWSEVSAHGRQAIRLYCPSGQVAELGNEQDATGRIFQFKRAELLAGVGRCTTAHIIGIIDNINGDCTCAAWEYGPQKLVTFTDNVHRFAYDYIGPLALDVLGLRP